MFEMNIPVGHGEPILWWLFWFAISLVIYTVLAIWFYRVGKRETREPSKARGK